MYQAESGIDVMCTNLTTLQALDQLYEARRILGFSYAFAFFMFGDMFKDEITPTQNEINKNLFENQQQAMEALVRQPSSLRTTFPWLCETFL